MNGNTPQTPRSTNQSQPNATPHIIVFAKYPIQGKVKTRLATGSNEQFATDLYRCFVQDIFEQLSNGHFSLELSLGFEHPEKEINDWIPQEKTITVQEGNTLGDRMTNAFQAAFSRGHSRVIIIGSDAPDLPTSVYHDAFEALNHHQICLGPSSDGGYYLIGFNAISFEPDIFENVKWSSSSVLSSTLTTISKLGLSHFLLPEWHDNDEVEDVRALYERLINGKSVAPKTLTYLNFVHKT